MSHTPGPWHVGPHYQSDVESREGRICDCTPLMSPRAVANARLIASTPDLLTTAKELLEACAAALRVIAEIDTPTRLKDLLGTPESREQALMDELRIAGVGDGFGIRAKAIIAKAEGREA